MAINKIGDKMRVSGWNTKYSTENSVVLRRDRYRADNSTALLVFSECR